MPQPNAVVRDGLIVHEDGDGQASALVGSAPWFAWLALATSTSFRFQDGPAPYTARREAQRGRWYWSAYRRQAGRLRKLYLGRAETLTYARLLEIGERFARLQASKPQPLATHAERRTFAALLSSEAASLLGREADTAGARAALDRHRLVTLTGPGGVGKTRLARGIAAGWAADSERDVCFVDLTRISASDQVAPAVAQAAGVRETTGNTLLTTLAESLNVEPVLVVLDNCEHVLESCASVAATLLEMCPALCLLTTSREALGIPGEVVWPVAPLALPVEGTDATGWWDAPATQLFVERARTARRDLALGPGDAPIVAAICRKLDGLPLAIELAASSLRLVSPAELLDRLEWMVLTSGERHRDTAPRHQSLRALVAWSLDLLTEPERVCFLRVSVFSGGFSLAAAEAVVVGDGIAPNDVAHVLLRLLDHSLLQVVTSHADGVTWYRVLEVLRAPGVAALRERGELAEVQRRHAQWYAAQTAEAEQAFDGPAQGYWLRWAEREHDNIRAALTWAVAAQETTIATRLVLGMAWPWLVHQRWSEGLEWVLRVLGLPGTWNARERGLLLMRAVELSLFRGDLASNRPSGDVANVVDWIAECGAIAEQLNDAYLRMAARGLSGLLHELGWHQVEVLAVDPEDELRDVRQAGHRWGVRRGLEAMARFAVREGNLAQAVDLLEEATALAREDQDGWSLAMALNALGDVTRAGGHPHLAQRHYTESAQVFAAIGLGAQPNLEHNLGYVALATGDPSSAAGHFTRALEQFRRLGERRGAAECLIGLGAVAVAERRLPDAGQLFGAGDMVLESMGIGLWEASRPDSERWRARARSGRPAGIARFERAYERGRSFPVDQAFVLAQTPAPAAPLPKSERVTASTLTPRECEVASLVAAGVGNEEIATALRISPKTVSNHVQRILEKLDLRSRVQLAARAGEFGIRPSETLVPRQR